MKRTAAGIGAISMAILAPSVVAAQSGPSLRLFSELGYSGDSYRAERSIENLDRVRFNDAAHSLIAEGRWEVCLDAGYSGGCRVVQGRISDMGDWNGSLSSARYLGPGDWGDAGGASGGGSGSWGAGDGGSSGQAQGQGAYRVDFEPQVIGGVYDSSFGRMTIERWDRDGAAARYDGLSGDGSDAGRVDGILEVYDGDGSATLRGHWYQGAADQSCSAQRNGTYYWGAVTLIFDRARNEFQGYWDYCDPGGAPESAWHGQRTGRDPAIAAAVDAQVAAGGGTGGARQGGQVGRLVLFDDNAFSGRSISLDRDTPSLHVEALDFGDNTFSLAAEGRWSVCEHVDYGGECRTVEGDQADLRDFGGTISSVRYLGPGASSRVLAGGGAGAGDRRSGGDRRAGQSGAVESAAERAARVAAEEAERRVHDRIREGIGRIF